MEELNFTDFSFTCLGYPLHHSALIIGIKDASAQGEGIVFLWTFCDVISVSMGTPFDFVPYPLLTHSMKQWRCLISGRKLV